MIQVACSMMLNDTGLLQYGQMSRVSNPKLKLTAIGTIIQHWTEAGGVCSCDFEPQLMPVAE